MGECRVCETDAVCASCGGYACERLVCSTCVEEVGAKELAESMWQNGSGVLTPDSKAFEMVREFHEATGLPVRKRPQGRVPELALRAKLIREELYEYVRAAEADDVVEVADALADLLYVVYGAALTHGIPVDAVFAEVHRSNMTKVLPDGSVLRREDGKVLKPDSFEEPDVAGILRLPRMSYTVGTYASVKIREVYE